MTGIIPHSLGLIKTYRVLLELGTQRTMLGYGFSDETPKGARMIELSQVAQLVHDNVVGQRWRQKCDFIIEIKIPFTRAATPPGLLVADCDAVILETVNRIEVREPGGDKRTGDFLRSEIFFIYALLFATHKEFIQPHHHHRNPTTVILERYDS